MEWLLCVDMHLCRLFCSCIFLPFKSESFKKDGLPLSGCTKYNKFPKYSPGPCVWLCLSVKFRALASLGWPVFNGFLSSWLGGLQPV